MGHWLVIDLEATTDEGGWPMEEMEIIEIGASLVGADGHERDHFQRIVKPQRRPCLTDFCRQLTHISQADIDSAAPMHQVWAQFERWLTQHAPRLAGWCSWGDYDRRQLEQDLISQVHHDELTGVTNRRRFQELARQRMRQAEAVGQPLSLLLLDVDYFKQINDTYGHLRGDEVLKALARVCRNHMDAEEVLARVGGEEFAMLLPEMDRDAARRQAERIRASVWNAPVVLADAAIHVSISIGVAQWRPGDSVAELLGRADQALQVAKYKGRDRVEVADGGESLPLAAPGSQNRR